MQSALPIFLFQTCRFSQRWILSCVYLLYLSIHRFWPLRQVLDPIPAVIEGWLYWLILRGMKKIWKYFFQQGKCIFNIYLLNGSWTERQVLCDSGKGGHICRWFWSTVSFSWPSPLSVKVLHPHLSLPSLSFTVRENAYTCHSPAAPDPECVENKIKSSACREVFEIPNVRYENNWTRFWQPV